MLARLDRNKIKGKTKRKIHKESEDNIYEIKAISMTSLHPKALLSVALWTKIHFRSWNPNMFTSGHHWELAPADGLFKMISNPRWWSPVSPNDFQSWESRTTRCPNTAASEEQVFKGDDAGTFRGWPNMVWKHRFLKNASNFAWIKMFEMPIVPAQFMLFDGEISFSLLIGLMIFDG